MGFSKTQNRKGNLAEVFRVDDKGVKCCILVPKGHVDKTRWGSFLNMLSFKAETEYKKHTYMSQTSKEPYYISTSDSSSKTKNTRRTYADVLS